MTTTQHSSTKPYSHDSAPARDWGLISTMIGLEARRHQIERAFPRLAINAQLWVEEQLLPKDSEARKRLNQMLRNQLVKHQILLCAEDVHIGIFKKGDLKDKPLEIIIQWAVAVPLREFEELATAARDLAARSTSFADRVQNAPGGRSV